MYLLLLLAAHSIVLMGRSDGELMYRLELESLDPEPVSVPLLTTELGK